MILRNIYLYLNPDEHWGDPISDLGFSLGTTFGFKTRYICNYLERHLKKLRFRTAGFNKICIQGSKLETATWAVQGAHAVVPRVSFNASVYEALDDDKRHELYIAMILDGLSGLAEHHVIPISEILDGIAEFRAGGYKNEWVHQTKYYRTDRVRATLHCSLKPNNFSMTLDISKDGHTVLKEVILECLPDEIIFAHRLGSLEWCEDTITVRQKDGAILYRSTSQ
ncbi:hypothetical protein K7565_12435 [Stenotrophomonas maltophilia]|nr:hypothetical protein K7565_12435 [Stenotrophomonas maltophilia]